MENNMTTGNPGKLIVRFTLPVFIGNVFQQFYSMVDAVIVGKFVGTKALAGVGATGTINFLIIGFLLGLTAGFTVLTAQKYGAGDLGAMRKTVASAAILSLVVSVVMTAASVIFMKNLLRLMNTPEDIFDYAYKNKLTFYLYTIDKKYGINLSDDTIIAEKHINVLDTDNIDFLKDETILKVIIKNKDMNKLQAQEVDIAKITNYTLEISYSSNMYMEINAKGVNKAVALKKVCDHYGLEMKDVLAIGDNYNDVAMLEAAGTSVAVKNARLQVKESADYVASHDNNKGAVGEAIEKFVLNL